MEVTMAIPVEGSEWGSLLDLVEEKILIDPIKDVRENLEEALCLILNWTMNLETWANADLCS